MGCVGPAQIYAELRFPYCGYAVLTRVNGRRLPEEVGYVHAKYAGDPQQCGDAGIGGAGLDFLERGREMSAAR